jgi:hypothetical protein
VPDAIFLYYRHAERKGMFHPEYDLHGVNFNGVNRLHNDIFIKNGQAQVISFGCIRIGFSFCYVLPKTCILLCLNKTTACLNTHIIGFSLAAFCCYFLAENHSACFCSEVAAFGVKKRQTCSFSALFGLEKQVCLV